jgi:hypothetical protein
MIYQSKPVPLMRISGQKQNDGTARFQEVLDAYSVKLGVRQHLRGHTATDLVIT